MDISLLAQALLEDSPFWTAANGPFTARLSIADSRLLVIAGSNASGKSLLFRSLAFAAHKAKVLPVTISIRERTGAGSSDMAGMRRAMMFGQEDQQSTGATSVKVVLNGFHNVLERSAVLMLDEPDLGLSEDYSQAFGMLLQQEHQRVLAENAKYRGLVLVTHSRALVRGLVAAGATPSFISMGLAPGEDGSLAGWLAGAKPRTVAELLALPDIASERRQMTAVALKN